MTDTAHLREVVDAASTELGRIEVVVSNDGYGVFGAAEALSDTQIDALIATNLTGCIQLARGVAPHLRAQAGVAACRCPARTNVLGPVRVLHAFTRLLDASSSPVVVNVSSSVSSLAYASDLQGPYAELNLLAYPASKAALNMLTIQWAKAHPRWRVNSADPGFTATNLNQYRGTQTLEGGTDAIVRLATVGPDGPTGTFSGRQGIAPW